MVETLGSANWTSVFTFTPRVETNVLPLTLGPCRPTAANPARGSEGPTKSGLNVDENHQELCQCHSEPGTKKCTDAPLRDAEETGTIGV